MTMSNHTHTHVRINSKLKLPRSVEKTYPNSKGKGIQFKEKIKILTLSNHPNSRKRLDVCIMNQNTLDPNPWLGLCSGLEMGGLGVSSRLRLKLRSGLGMGGV